MYMVWGLVLKLFALIPHQTSHVMDGSFHCILLGYKLMGAVSKGNVYKLWFMGVYKLPLVVLSVLILWELLVLFYVGWLALLRC
jgi:hypothetical protein